MTKVVQFGLRFSPNLGDGVISDCLVHGIRTRLPEAEIETVDLSGRLAYGHVAVRNRALKIKVLEALPRFLRHRLVTHQLERLIASARPAWQSAVHGADAAFIGGGQLFSDADLNFCLKIAAASDILAEAKVPTAVHAVGVARNWSPRGRELFEKVFTTDLRWIGVRDDHSLRAWQDQVETHQASNLQLVRDPGLLAERTYGKAPATDQIGLCVTDPMILAYHADTSRSTVANIEFFAEIATRLVAEGCQVVLFCNGAVEDQTALRELSNMHEIAPLVRSGKIKVAPIPDTPKILAHLISELRVVIAHRLHACIVSYAFGSAAVGLGWDKKVESFFSSIGREDLFLSDHDMTSDAVVEAVFRAMERGLNPDEKRDLADETQSGIDQALDAMLAGSMGAISGGDI